ncbi:LOW QUALITY PROTEIN: hypothetical protein SC1083_1852 [Aggregatibacter actinomycetemcomitans serotype e str. SC1083]|uniref:Uncharacterized protein n=1 Tax=Aggregatibacter actinomycetemcomitans serotype e str. SC1083 TaxID=907488 RepID=G4AAH9_AGGAC|nr:LOW QUALITY PROTEIN: hypothetical protein SC1083_1852 [Aggregatibacter actinomycetemcomitans serotype e str. SC1083]KYK72333.1 hypothetical protein SA3096_10505 [Aggregatibacter actinomycetemcomitans serotype e str. SA3096]
MLSIPFDAISENFTEILFKESLMIVSIVEKTFAIHFYLFSLG